MLKVYTVAGCPVCRKAKLWLKEKEIEFVEDSLFNLLSDEEDFNALLGYFDYQVNQLFDKEAAEKNGIYFQRDMIDQLFIQLQRSPSLMRRPIIICEGQNNEEETILQLQQLLADKCKKECPHYLLCGKVREVQ